jgi:hypothetical protein
MRDQLGRSYQIVLFADGLRALGLQGRASDNVCMVLFAAYIS